MRGDLPDLLTKIDQGWGEVNPSAAIAEHFAADGVLFDMTAGEPVVGREAIAAALTVFTDAFSDMACVSTLVADDGVTATVEWAMTGTHTGELDGIAPTGRTFEIRGVNLLVVDDTGHLAQERSYWDSGTLLRQLGVFDG